MLERSEPMSQGPTGMVLGMLSIGMAGVGAKAAEQGLDLASVSAFLGALAAALMSASAVIKQIADALIRWKQATPTPLALEVTVAQSPVEPDPTAPGPAGGPTLRTPAPEAGR